ncbi:MAG: VCBS repeat-containing protein, partial [bacterium]
MIKHLLTIGLLAIAYCNASEFKEYSFIEGSLTQVTTSDIPGCKWVKSPKSLKLSPKDFNFKPRDWEPIPKELSYLGSPKFGDIDNDGDYDLAIGYRDSNIISFFENVGSKYNAIFKLKGTTTIPNSFGHIALGDIDKDGKIDLLFADYSAENIKGYKIISWNNLERNPNWDTHLFHAESIFATAPDLGDLDNDKDLDLCVFCVELASNGRGTISFLFYENNSGSWTRRNDWDVPVYKPLKDLTGISNASLGVVDLYNDGGPDLVITREEYGFPYIYLNIGTQSPVWKKNAGTYTNGLGFSFSKYGEEVSLYALTGDILGGTVGFADLDNDGDSDMLMGSIDYFCPAFENIGTLTDYTFTTKQRTYLEGYHATGGIGFADLDNDGDYEEFLGEGEVSCIGPTAWIVFNGGTPEDAYFFRAKTGKITILPGGQNFNDSRPSFVDMDNDGDLDLFRGYYSKNGHSIGAFMNNNNSFQYYSPWDITASFLQSQGLDDLETIDPWHTVVDLNNDKKYDLIITTEQARCFLENTGTRENATWTRRKDWEQGFECLHGPEGNTVMPQAIDIDGDNQE